MPYRRLPNTDQARIRALKAVVVKGDICNVYDLAVSLKALTYNSKALGSDIYIAGLNKLKVQSSSSSLLRPAI